MKLWMWKHTRCHRGEMRWRSGVQEGVVAVVVSVCSDHGLLHCDTVLSCVVSFGGECWCFRSLHTWTLKLGAGCSSQTLVRFSYKTVRCHNQEHPLSWSRSTLSDVAPLEKHCISCDWSVIPMNRSFAGAFLEHSSTPVLMSADSQQQQFHWSRPSAFVVRWHSCSASFRFKITLTAIYEPIA
jgi:hypothetical protein